MLKQMRRKAKYFYVLFFIIILSFVFWGVGMDSQTQTPLAVIEGERITLDEYWRMVRRTEDAYRDAYGEQYDEVMRQNVQDQVLNSMIEERVLFLAAMDAGITTSDQEVQDAIMSDTNFQVNGAFSSDQYRQILSRARISPAIYEDMVRREAIVQKMRHLIGSSITVSSSDLETVSDDPQISATIAQAMEEQRRQQAVSAFVNGLMRNMKVEINRELLKS